MRALKDENFAFLKSSPKQLYFRLQNKRVARSLVVGVHQGHVGNASSRSCALASYSASKMADTAFGLLRKYDTAGAGSTTW